VGTENVPTLLGWMEGFIGVSRIALSKEPEYLERLGLVDPS